MKPCDRQAHRQKPHHDAEKHPKLGCHTVAIVEREGDDDEDDYDEHYEDDYAACQT
jgi:hypothetical protein